jgi:hypothetical protein
MTVHDEYDAEMLPEYVEAYSEVCLQSIGLAGEYYKIRLPVTGEVKQGRSWLEVH